MEFRQTFQIGLNGTGTRSVAAAISYLGNRKLRVIHGLPIENREKRSAQYTNSILKGTGRVPWFSDYDFIGELAAPLWKQIDEEWPNSRFILNVRPVDDWVRSTKVKTESGSSIAFRRRRMRLQRGEPAWQLSAIYQLITFGSLQYTARHADRYEHHNKEVIEHFSNRNDLLVFDCFNGDSWGQLSRFLDLPLPDENVPFPRIRRSHGPTSVPIAANKLHKKYGR